MGLDCSHDAFHGAYSAFNRLRQAVAEATGPGGSYPPHEDKRLNPARFYISDDWPESETAGIYLFLSHSDCDGILTPEECSLVARDLEKLLDKVSEEYGGGHISRDGGVRAALEKFIAGCRSAAAAGENLEFQ